MLSGQKDRRTQATKIVGKHELWRCSPAPAQELHWLADCERRLNPRGLFELKYIPPALRPIRRYG
jgi:hypothetical protein